MKRLSLLILAGLLVGLYVTRDRWVDAAPSWVARLVGTEAAAARTPPDAGSAGASGADAGRRKGPRQVAVVTAGATKGALPVTRRTIGYVRPLASTTIASEAVGIVADIAVKDGATVRTGDVLVRLDDRAARADVAKDEAALDRDRATLDNAQAGLDRIGRLVQSGASTKQAGDDAAATVKSAEATVALDQAALTADEVVLSKTELKAPFDGRIGAFSVSLGSLVQSGGAIVTLTQMAPVYAEFSLPETDLGLIRGSLEAKTVTVSVKPSLAAADMPAETGPVVFVDNAIDEASASFRIRAELDNADAALWPGQSIDVEVTAGEEENLVLVPGVAVEPRDAGSIVYVVKADGTVEVRKVDVALRNGDMAGIRSGLEPGEKVVVEGQVDLADGTPVREAATGGTDATKAGAGGAKAGAGGAKAGAGEAKAGAGETKAGGADAKGGPA